MPSARASGEGKDLNLKLVDRKSDNDGKRFIFRTFAQRVAAANIDVFHRLTADQADERELLGGDITDAPLAMSTMERWTELNCTGAFKAFNKELSPMLLSVPLMLHRRAELFSALNRHLAAAPSMALKPMLEVTSAIAADLRQEFYAEFPALLATLAALLSPSDVQLLEDVFSTLCYLFKYLLRQLLADLPAAFGAYRPLLAHERAHVRDFAAESFSFLLRRLTASKLPSAVAHAILPHVGAHGAALDQGIAQLFFYTVRGLGHAFHSRAPIVVKALILLLHPTFGSLAPASVSAPLARGAAAKALAREAAAKALAVREGGGGDEGPLMPVVVEALHLMSEHTRRAHASGVWIPLTDELKGAIEAWLRRLRRLAVAVEQADDEEEEGEEEEEEEGEAEEEAEEEEEEATGAGAKLCRRALRAVRTGVGRLFATRAAGENSPCALAFPGVPLAAAAAAAATLALKLFLRALMADRTSG
jgi:U3 small nucleolar RNA-associated protein 20